MAEYIRPQTQEDLAHSFEQLKPLMNATEAFYESARCLFCYDAPCVKACPSEIDIPLFIRQINNDNLKGAAKTIYESNYFGHICGKVCPTEELCEGACVYNHQGVKPIEIGRLQSYATTDAIRKNKRLFRKERANGKKVAIIGAGPAGISCACELRLLGYEVKIFEAKPHPSGLAVYGCAPYKVTNAEVFEEIDYLSAQFGFDIAFNKTIKTEEDITMLEKEFDAVFLGIGLGNTRSLNIPGEDLANCIGATEFIEQVKINPLGIETACRTIVVGGGNTAMDAASESARLGVEEVLLAYRRSKEEMRAYDFEYDLAKGAGVKGLFNVAPVEIFGTDKVSGVRFVRTEIVDGKVRTKPDSEFEIACDRLILATGQQKQIEFLHKIKGLEVDRSGRIKVSGDSFQTTNPKYFAAGDAVNGGAEVVNACGEAKKAARAIHRFLSGV